MNALKVKPSSSYRAEVWRVGLLAAKFFPRSVCRAFSWCAGFVYSILNPARVATVAGNLGPVFDGNEHLARRAARSLIRRFSLKMTDLFLCESGAHIKIDLVSWSGYEHFQSAVDRGRGVLFVTPHVGNWEYGGYLLAQRGVRLLVLTQAEPGREFTELRRAGRAQWGVETFVVGQDPLAFVEVIKRLQDGANVALLIDRPSPPTAVTVDFFGRPFRASVAAAELARASGCTVVPVYIVQSGSGYSAHILPEVPYDRAALGNKEGRRQYTGQIMRAFEPVIRNNADQWYHFVSIWPDQVKQL